MNVADLIREAREERKWSQERLAREADVSFGTVRRYERGDAKHPSEEHLGRICEALGIPFTPSVPARIGEEAA